MWQPSTAWLPTEHVGQGPLPLLQERTADLSDWSPRGWPLRHRQTWRCGWDPQEDPWDIWLRRLGRRQRGEGPWVWRYKQITRQGGVVQLSQKKFIQATTLSCLPKWRTSTPGAALMPHEMTEMSVAAYTGLWGKRALTLLLGHHCICPDSLRSTAWWTWTNFFEKQNSQMNGA